MNNLSDDIICNTTTYTYDTTVYSKYDWASDLWQPFELTSEVESDLWDTVDWSRKRLHNFNVEKTQLFSFDWPSNSSAIDVDIDESVPWSSSGPIVLSKL